MTGSFFTIVFVILCDENDSFNLQKFEDNFVSKNVYNNILLKLYVYCRCLMMCKTERLNTSDLPVYMTVTSSHI